MVVAIRSHTRTVEPPSNRWKRKQLHTCCIESQLCVWLTARSMRISQSFRGRTLASFQPPPSMRPCAHHQAAVLERRFRNRAWMSKRWFHDQDSSRHQCTHHPVTVAKTARATVQNQKGSGRSLKPADQRIRAIGEIFGAFPWVFSSTLTVASPCHACGTAPRASRRPHAAAKS